MAYYSPEWVLEVPGSTLCTNYGVADPYEAICSVNSLKSAELRSACAQLCASEVPKGHMSGTTFVCPGGTKIFGMCELSEISDENKEITVFGLDITGLLFWDQGNDPFHQVVTQATLDRASKARSIYGAIVPELASAPLVVAQQFN